MSKVKQSKTSCDLSDSVGPTKTHCQKPKKPLSSRPSTSLLKPSWSFPQLRQGRNTQPPKKASSVTVLKSVDVISRKSNLPSGNPSATGNKNKPAVRSKASISRIPLPIRTVRASRSENDIKLARQEKPVMKRCFSSPTLGGNVLESKVPVKIQKGNKKDSIGKTNNGVMEKHTDAASNGTFQDRLSFRRKEDILDGSTNSKPTQKLEAFKQGGVCESSILVVSCETDSGDETVEKKNSNEPLPSKDRFHVADNLLNKEGAGKPCRLSSSVPTGFEKDNSSNSAVDTEIKTDDNEKVMESEENLLDPTLHGSFESYNSLVGYHRSSILLIARETELSSESGAESDVKIDSVDKLSEEKQVEPSAGESKVFKSSSQTPKIERDSGIVLSRASSHSNQSSLLVISRDTDYSMNELQQKSDTNIKSQEKRKEKNPLQSTSSSDEKRKNEKRLDTTKENVLLRGKFARIKQTNSTLRSNEKTLLQKIEDQMDKNELLSNKSCRLRAQVKNLKRMSKKSKMESKQQEKALRQNVENLKTKLAAADKLNSTLKANLQESEKVVSRQNLKILEADKILSEHVAKIKELEKTLEDKRDELYHADKLVVWQKDEIRKADKEIEKQNAELRVVDEETVKQLEKIQKTFAVFEEREHSLEEAIILCDKQVASLEGQLSIQTQKLAKIEEQLETKQYKNNALKVQIRRLKRQLAASQSLEQKAAKMNDDLLFDNEQLVNECERFQEEFINTNYLLEKFESELHEAVIARDTQSKQFEQQLVSVENEKNELRRINSQLTCQLNVSKTNKSAERGQEVITQQCGEDQMKELEQLDYTYFLDTLFLIVFMFLL